MHPGNQLQSTNSAFLGIAINRLHGESPKPDEFAAVWRELELPAVIPFDETERQNQCEKALNVLRPYMDIHSQEASGL